ncbi:MAG: ArnT family glycosyltransferase, partial [Anaerolineae bacterium]
LGSIGALRAEAGWALLAIAIVRFLPSIRAWLSDLGSLPRALAVPRGLSRWAAAYCIFALSIAFLHALAPATAWDALVYHLKGPDLYLAAGRIGHPIDLPYLGFPQFQEMLFLLARLIGAPTVALLHWVFAVATVLLIHSMARRIWGEVAGWLAMAIFLSAPSIVGLAGSPYVDLTLAFHVTAAFACMRHWRAGEDGGWLRLAGLFAGFAMATKYTAAAAVVGLVVLVFFGDWSRLLQYVGIVVLAASPWYLKNLIVTGNPVYPFFFDAPYWDSLRAAWYSRLGTGLAFTSPLRLLTAPIEATLLGVQGRQPFDATIGPLFLMFVPVAIIGVRRRLPGFEHAFVRDWMRDALIVCGVVYLGWLAMIAASALLAQTRLLFPIFPLLAVMAAGGFYTLRQSETLSAGARRVVSAVVAAWLALTAFGLAIDFGASGVASALSGGRSRDDYLVDRLGWHVLAMQSINRLPAGSRVMFLWEPRSLYCRLECHPDALLDRWWHARRVIGSPDAIAEAWRAAGITHVLLFRAGYQFILDDSFDPITAEDQAALATLIDSHLTLVQNLGDEYEVYAWRSESAREEPP